MKETIASCKMQRNHLDNVVIIDLDSDDVPTGSSLHQNFSGSTLLRDDDDAKRFQCPSIIIIDDDDDDEDEDGCDYVDNQEFNVESDKDYVEFMQKSEDADVDDCRVVFEKRPAFKLSKCNNKAFTKDSSSRNRYGLDFESDAESGSSGTEGSSSDCEVIECSFAELHEDWVRKFNADYKGQSGLRDDSNVRVENSSRQNVEANVCSGSDVNFYDVNSSYFTATGDGFTGGAFSFGDDVHFGKDKCMEDLNFLFDKYQSENGAGGRFQNEGEVAGSSCYAEGQKPLTNSSSNILINDGKNPLHAPSAVQNDIINEREKLKETDEFKRAVEEEWAARQQQLQIQAEEAQRLRKRKKAETLRILDMEKRLKQRVEEVRETQRKDEENLNLKENLRAEVRKELCQLEDACIDMASLLRRLGIQVEGGFHPLSQEVHAAYKRAVLKFHPDRASRTDARQQVEAEEKFKLITRMKEKFLSTSCH